MSKDEQPLRGLQTVRVKRLDVLNRLTDNKDKHRAIFLEAIEGYHAEVVKKLEDALEEARAGKNYNTHFHLPQPQDHTPEYVRLIELLTLSLDDELELTQQEFSCYVLDDWGWKPDFVGTVSNYTASRP